MLLNGYDYQGYITNRLAMPVDDVNETSYVQSISGETLQLYYFNSGVPTADAGQAAGTVVIGVLAYKNILDRMGVMIGNELETSVSFTTGTIFPAASLKRCEYTKIGDPSNATLSEIASALTTNFTNGQWCIDHRNGIIYGKKATTGTADTVAYKVSTKTTGGGGGTIADKIQGNIAHDAPDSGNPIKEGGKAASSRPTAVSAGDRVDAYYDVYGRQHVYDEGGGGVGGGGYMTYQFTPTNSLGQGTTAYAGATTLTVSGHNFTPESVALIKIEQYNSSYVLQNTYTPQQNTITASTTSGVTTYTVTGASFSASDLFQVFQSGPERTTVNSTDSQRNAEINPVPQQCIEESLVDTTNVAAAATYYPSSLGTAQLGYSPLSFSVKFIDGDATTTTFGLQITNDEDQTNADWIAYPGQITIQSGTLTGIVGGTSGVSLVNGNLVSVITSAAAQTSIFFLDFGNLNCRYWRFALTPGDATNTSIIKARRAAL